jgi:acyl dehydratase
MSDLSVVEGRTYGPRTLVPTAATTARYAEATSDAGSWTTQAPPSWAGAVLFAVAPDFLADPDVQALAGGVVHADQSFTWHAPFAHDVPLEVTGTVTRVRSRGDNAWVSFALEASAGGTPVLESASTFVVTGAAPEAADAIDEPPVTERAGHGGAHRSASRADLVAYAAASGDLNPIHWDHDSAVAAGLPGIVCHGLLLSAWCLQPIAEAGRVATARIRFRSPVLAAAATQLVHEADGSAHSVSLSVGDTTAVIVTAEVTA